MDGSILGDWVRTGDDVEVAWCRVCGCSAWSRVCLELKGDKVCTHHILVIVKIESRRIKRCVSFVYHGLICQSSRCLSSPKGIMSQCSAAVHFIGNDTPPKPFLPI